ncbi:Metallo-hydrolase/oxidoreductase [Linderina pennispora]|uniref:Metallo-hydrolase/oxidoreductase n=1 Tax=Linderina pennispora TaxID=61395 RepID=A0A1Y1W6E2_9FUNG|nr:Metallo-hydrolase/oxidoreductase [Linderina pennispora]ORX69081.1 Metallo-hydrolase/oxidoreductase [Linderina pennispora]
MAQLQGQELRQQLAKDKSHHLPNGRFKNPWNSFQPASWLSYVSYLLFRRSTKLVTQSIEEGRAPEVLVLDTDALSNPPKDKIQFTWLGQSSLFVQIDGANILFDPALSERCSPVQWIGPKRITKAPCAVAELPRIDAVVLSHDHVDHLDWNTLTDVVAKYPEIQILAPLGNGPILKSIGFKNIRLADWWDELEIELGAENKSLTFACTPAQHSSGRGFFDKDASLWASWVVQGSGRFFFSGDSGYSASNNNPTGAKNPAFEQIGKVYGPIDLAAIAIGIYSPPEILDSLNMQPEQSVKVHEEIRSRRSIGVHWGTLAVTEEPVDEPPQRLAAEVLARGHQAEDFGVIRIGETVQQAWN